MIAEVLNTGAENPITGRDLARLFNCSIRDITEQIEKERREGKPICACSSGNNAGYYLASSRDELENYCSRLNKREMELRKTRLALHRIRG